MLWFVLHGYACTCMLFIMVLSMLCMEYNVRLVMQKLCSYLIGLRSHCCLWKSDSDACLDKSDSVSDSCPEKSESDFSRELLSREI